MIEGAGVWDANCRIGRSAYHPAGAPTTAPELLAVMDEYGIDHALVYHVLAKENSPAIGNRRLGEAITDRPRLHASWVLLPAATAELPPPAELLELMKAADVRAVRLAPAMAHFPATPWALRSLLEPLAERRVPLFLDYHWTDALHDHTDWRAVYELAAAFPTLPIVLVGVGLGPNRISYALLDELPNLRLELSTNWQYRRVEDITRRFGPERLLFGTNMPLYDPGGVLACLAYADIEPAARAAIAGGNLCRLLADVCHDVA